MSADHKDGELQDESISSVDLEHSNGGNQLPNVEEYKVQAAASGGKRPRSKISRKRRARVILIVASFVIVAVICIAVGVSIGKNNGSSPPSESSLPWGEDTNDEDAGPSGVATNPPGTPSSRRTGIADLVGSLGWSSTESLQTPGTPQYHATVWLADVDPMGIEVKDTVEFRQRYAIAVFYYALKKDQTSWYASQTLPWFSAESVCTWTTSFSSSEGPDVPMGVLCHGGSVVKELRFSKSGASGAIPDEIILLEELEGLFLEVNDLSSPLNPKLGALKSLKDLGLASNNFEGKIPDFLGTISWNTLDLSNNKFNGALPDISAWSSLVSLDLSYNDLVDDIEKLSGITNIHQLSLGSNKFNGELTSSLLTAWSDIEALDVSDNKLEGELPENLFNMPKLVILDLHSNYFSGPLPTQVAVDAPLELLAVHDNKLDGKIDVVANKLVNLKHLDLSNNGFSGVLPSFVLLDELRYLYLFNTTNLEGGPIPPSITQLPLLIDLSLQHSRRTGTIPTELGDLKKLVLLDLGYNELEGSIPEDLGRASSLAFVLLNRNKLNGTIPDSLAKLNYLESLLVDRNDLVGPPGQICDKKPPLFKDFIADCKDIECSEETCCTVCCIDGDTDRSTTCNDIVWNGQLDPDRDTSYKRTGYKFNNKGIIYPVQSAQKKTDDTWDMWGARY